MINFGVKTKRVAQPGPLRHWEVQGSVFEGSFERGRLRISAVSEGIVRVRFAPEAFAPRRSWNVAAPDDALGPVALTLSESEEALRLEAGPLRITVGKDDGRLAFEDERGHRFAEDLTQPGWLEAELEETRIRTRPGDTLPPGRASLELRLKKRMAEDEHYYGFGQRAGGLERRRRVFSQWTFDPEAGHGRHQDNLYQAHPVFMALRRGCAWGLFLNSTWYSQFDVGAEEEGVLELVAHGGELDYYLFAGPTPQAVVERLTRLTGRPLMPPLWALGYHQSRWGYGSAEEMLELASEFRRRDIPLDVLHFDIDYMRGYRDFTWHPERFPDPKGLLDRLREEGIHVVTIIDPGVKNDLGAGYRVADEGVAQGVFVTDAEGKPFVGYCWPDAALFPDFAREEVRAWWGEQHRGHIEAGVAGVWNDMNEPAIFQRPFSEGPSDQHPMPLATVQGEGEERTVHAEVHNLYGHLMAQATYEGLKRLRPDERPWVLTRSAFVGTQRYAASWMGDNHSWWEHLQLSLPQLASVGLSGAPFCGVDIGGFFESSYPELYARWVELGTFYPFMRTHTAAGTQRQEPWSFGPEVEGIAREAIRLRYRLLPYLYTLAHHAHRSGDLFLRPLLYDFPEDERTFELGDEIMVGPQLLVAPILHPRQDCRLVYLPEGRWYSFWTGKSYPAGYSLVQAPLGRIPLFVRGGAVLTLGTVRRSTMEPLTELTLEVYPGGESTWTLLEDDGLSWAYQQGELAETTVRVSEAPEGVRVELEPRQGGYTPHARELILRVHLSEAPKRVLLDGEEQAAEWDERQGAVVLRWPDDGEGHEVQVHKES